MGKHITKGHPSNRWLMEKVITYMCEGKMTLL